MRKYTLRDNLISGLIGVIIAIPICIAASNSWDHKEPVKVARSETILESETLSLPIAGVSVYTVPEIKVVDLTEEDIEEEMYYDSLELFALCVEAEAGNQGLEGKRLVADVILNRVDDPDFPDTIYDVITQPYHFSTYWDGAIERAEATEETYKAIEMELEERSYPALLYFTAGGYGKYGTPWRQIGDHYFCTK